MKSLSKMSNVEIIECISNLSLDTQTGHSKITPEQFNDIVCSSLKKMFFVKHGTFGMETDSKKIDEAEKLLREI